MKKKKPAKSKKKSVSKKKVAKKTVKKAHMVNPDIVFREEGKEALLFDPDTGSIKVLNYVGKMIWKLLNGKNSNQDIVKKLNKKFEDVSEKTLSKDLDKFLKSLDKNGYLGKEL